MRGASRGSYADLRDRLGVAAPGAAAAEQVGDELFAVVRLLDAEHGLRRALADATKAPAEKSASALRSPCSASSSRTTANSSSPTCSAVAALGAATASRSRRSA